jgi:hypothetical protein
MARIVTDICCIHKPGELENATNVRGMGKDVVFKSFSARKAENPYDFLPFSLKGHAEACIIKGGFTMESLEGFEHGE